MCNLHRPLAGLAGAFFPQALLRVRLQVVRLGVMDVLSHLTSNLGKYLASSTVESMTIAAKYVTSYSAAHSCSLRIGLQNALTLYRGLDS